MTESPGVSRRGFLKGGALLGLALPTAGLLTACGDDGDGAGGAGAEAQTGELRVAHLPWIGNVATWLPDLKQQFEDEHQGVTVSIAPLAQPPGDPQALIQRLTLEARKGESSYDVLLGPTPFGVVGALAKAEAIADIGDLIPEQLRGQMPDSVLSEVTAPDDKVYAFPFWQDVIGFLYNKELLSAAGLSAPPASWDDLTSGLAAVKSKLSGGSFGYGADWNWATRLFLPILATLTDRPYADNGTIDMDSPAALDALTILNDLVGYMPPSASKELGSAEAFQAGKVVMTTYWQAQYFRAQEAGLAEAQLGMGANLAGSRNSTVFWSTVALFPAASPKIELAMEFVTTALLGEHSIEQSINSAGRFLPLDGIADRYPDWMRPMYEQMLNGSPLPLNDSYPSVVEPNFKTEIERMVVEGQSPQDTQRNLSTAFADYQW